MPALKCQLALHLFMLASSTVNDHDEDLQCLFLNYHHVSVSVGFFFGATWALKSLTIDARLAGSGHQG